MQLQTRPSPEHFSNVIQFMPLREAEDIFRSTLHKLSIIGVRRDIAQQLASYAAFNNEEFDEDGQYLVRVFEEIGQEPEVNGRMAA